MKTCPKCNSHKVSSNNPFGRFVCEDCGWISPREAGRLPFSEIIRPIYRWTFIFVLLATSLTVFVQFFQWQQYSFEASYLQMKSVFTGNDEKINTKLGAICNSLEDYDCSVRFFYKVVDENPNNKPALANLAIALAKTKKWKRARPNFEAYFSLGGGAFDVVYWYGKSLFELGKQENSLKWFYYSLKLNPNFLQAGRDLVDYLMEHKKMDGALSLVAAINRGAPEKSNYWRRYLESEDFVLREPETDEEISWTLPSLDGVNFYLPVILKRNSRIKFFRLDEGLEKNFVNKETLSEMLINWDSEVKTKNVEFRGKQIDVFELKLEDILIGNWQRNSIKVYVCEDCPNSLGQKFLRAFNVERWAEHKTSFVKLSLKNKERGNAVF